MELAIGNVRREYPGATWASAEKKTGAGHEGRSDAYISLQKERGNLQPRVHQGGQGAPEKIFPDGIERPRLLGDISVIHQ